jgi:WD40 repeat protein
MLALFVLHPNRPWVARVRSFWHERLGADPSAEAAARRPRLAARRVALVPTCERFRLAGHRNQVVSLLAHPSRPLLLSGSYDNTVRVWDLDSRSVVRTLAGHTGWVYGLALCPNGKRLASGSMDNTVRLWDLESGACLRTLAGHSSHVFAVAWEATGTLVATGSVDKTVRVWHADSGALQRTLVGHFDTVNALAAHPRDDLLASGSDDKTVRVWRFSSGAHVRTLAGHTGAVSSLAASKEWLVSGSLDQTLRVWSWETGICARVLDGFAGRLYLNSLAWRDSRKVTLESDGTVRVWDTGSPDPLAWSCVGSLKEKASYRHGVAVVDGGIVCAAPGDHTTIAVWAAE